MEYFGKDERKVKRIKIDIPIKEEGGALASSREISNAL